jgi:hypothetical protein
MPNTIQQLLSHFSAYPERCCLISAAGKQMQYEKSHFNFRMGMYFICALTLAWILYKCHYYHIALLRPREIFAPKNIFGHTFMPVFPLPELFYGIALFSFVMTLSRFFRPENIFVRVALPICLLWMNNFESGFGGDSEVGHLLLYAHLFSVVIPFKPASTKEDAGYIYKMICWFYTSILVTYSISGLWKMIGLMYKLFFKPHEVHWLHRDAALFNAFVNHRGFDLPFDQMKGYFDCPLFWQVSFVVVLYIQIFSVFAAFRPPLLFYAGIALILFHLVNSYVFLIVFISTPLALACLFFPYDLLLRNDVKNSVLELRFSGKYKGAVYQRKYMDGGEDRYLGYYAYRERYFDVHPLLAGILYAPGLALLTQTWWKYRLVFSKRNASFDL